MIITFTQRYRPEETTGSSSNEFSRKGICLSLSLTIRFEEQRTLDAILRSKNSLLRVTDWSAVKSLVGRRCDFYFYSNWRLEQTTGTKIEVDSLVKKQYFYTRVT